MQGVPLSSFAVYLNSKRDISKAILAQKQKRIKTLEYRRTKS